MSDEYVGPPGGSSGPANTNQNVSPTSGQTTVVPDGSGALRNHLVWATPAATLAAWTVQLPSDAGSQINDEVSIGSSKAITVLSVTGATTAFNAATLLNIGDLFTLKKVAANTWARKE